jgi:hypothetical protein
VPEWVYVAPEMYRRELDFHRQRMQELEDILRRVDAGEFVTMADEGAATRAFTGPVPRATPFDEGATQ